MTPDPIGLEGGVNLFAYATNNPMNLIDPKGLSIAGKIINLGFRGFKKLGNVTKRAAKEAAEQGEDILAKNRDVAEEIARAAGGGKRPTHHPPHGPAEEGYRSHYHPFPGNGGPHIFYSILAIIASFLDPFDAISGELADFEDLDLDGNGIPDWKEEDLNGNGIPDWKEGNACGNSMRKSK